MRLRPDQVAAIAAELEVLDPHDSVWVDFAQAVTDALRDAATASAARGLSEARRQIIWALERSAIQLEIESTQLLDQQDYNAQFPGEDAQRHREAIELISQQPECWRAQAIRWLRLKQAGIACACARWPRHAAAYPLWEAKARWFDQLARELAREGHTS